ncbi:MAG: hypothetical protein VXY05_05210 [Pseudomonadota bacterium]|nr:hypothetical protein [Pseudomonadota bacterium]
MVDDDIDPPNIFDVFWALSTRCGPLEDVQFSKRAWSMPHERPQLQAPWGIISASMMSAASMIGRMKSRPLQKRHWPLRQRSATNCRTCITKVLGKQACEALFAAPPRHDREDQRSKRRQIDGECDRHGCAV